MLRVWREKGMGRCLLEKWGERWKLTHVEGFEVFANFGDKLFTALIALREAFI
jgi:hypothetical protein